MNKDDFSNQCAKILEVWIMDYLKRHNLELMEIDWESRCVACYSNDCENIFEDYFTFDYTKVDLFS